MKNLVCEQTFGGRTSSALPVPSSDSKNDHKVNKNFSKEKQFRIDFCSERKVPKNMERFTNLRVILAQGPC